jgi:cytosine/adenosine deaminase-related metal-dependent hydrolase
VAENGHATFYAVNGVLTSRRPSRIEESVDLANGFVIPPFGDAHCHHFDSERGLENFTSQSDQRINLVVRLNIAR